MTAVIHITSPMAGAMAGQKDNLEPSDGEPVTDNLAMQEELAGQARQLGQQHRAAGITPFGDAGYVRWDEGSARLLTALGETSPTASSNAAGRYRVVEAYCGELEAPGAVDAEPGS
jgi:hypothetical protein